MDIFKEKMSDMPMQTPVKVAQSNDEALALLARASMGDMGARSVEHTERPRYGHKV